MGVETCAFSVTTATMDDAKQQLTAHAHEAHADMMAAATPESMEQWDKKLEEVWAAAPEA